MNRKNRAEDMLLALGVKPNLKGFHYLVDAVDIYLNHKGDLSITKGLYPEIARKHNTTGSRVERSIRHAIELTADCNPYGEMERFFGTTTNMNKGKLTNSEFISVFALRLAREEREGDSVT